MARVWILFFAVGSATMTGFSVLELTSSRAAALSFGVASLIVVLAILGLLALIEQLLGTIAWHLQDIKDQSRDYAKK